MSTHYPHYPHGTSPKLHKNNVYRSDLVASSLILTNLRLCRLLYRGGRGVVNSESPEPLQHLVP